MPRGGSRPGAGRKPDPNSKRQQALAAKSAKPAAPAPAKAKATGTGLTQPDGTKAPGAPGSWPFGTQAPAAEAPAAPTSAPDADDGLTDEQRAGLAPLDYLLAVMRSSKASLSTRMTAAIQAAPYVHAKPAPAGKKEGKNDEARKVGSRFAPAAPPKLAAVGGKKV